MRVTPFHNVAAFAERVTPLLAQNEAENCLLLGQISELQATDTEGPSDAAPLMLALEGAAGVPVAAAIVTPAPAAAARHPAVVSRAGPEAVAALLTYLEHEGVDLRAIAAPEPTATIVADAWCEATGGRRSDETPLRLYRLTRVIHPRAPGGTFRAASPQEEQLLVAWADGFFRHIGDPAPRDRCERAVRQRLEDGRLFVWCDPAPVTMAGWAGRTPTGARVNFVYTPPEHRGRGYASACVARLSQHLLDSGRQFCCLFTEASNPTTNKIYRAIGYEEVGPFRHVSFEKLAAGGGPG